MRKMAAAALAAFLVVLSVAGPATANVRVDRMVNNFRVNHDLRRLKSADHENQLWRLAFRRTYQIERNWGHRSDWQWFFDRLPRCATGIGENIAYYRLWGEPPPYRWPFTAWRDSPDHRANMLGNWTWQASAIRKVRNGDGSTSYWAVQLFLKGCRHRSTL